MAGGPTLYRGNNSICSVKSRAPLHKALDLPLPRRRCKNRPPAWDADGWSMADQWLIIGSFSPLFHGKTTCERMVIGDNVTMDFEWHFLIIFFQSFFPIGHWLHLHSFPVSIWLWLTVRHGKIHPCYFQNGSKPSISIRAMENHHG